MTTTSIGYYDIRNNLSPASLRQIRCSTDFTEQPKERRYFVTNKNFKYIFKLKGWFIWDISQILTHST